MNSVTSISFSSFFSSSGRVYLARGVSLTNRAASEYFVYGLTIDGRPISVVDSLLFFVLCAYVLISEGLRGAP